MNDLFYIYICRNSRLVTIPYHGVESAWDAWENIVNALAGTGAHAELFDPSYGIVIASTNDF